MIINFKIKSIDLKIYLEGFIKGNVKKLNSILWQAVNGFFYITYKCNLCSNKMLITAGYNHDLVLSAIILCRVQIMQLFPSRSCRRILITSRLALKLKHRRSTNASCCEFLARTCDIEKEKERGGEKEKENWNLYAKLEGGTIPADTHPEYKGMAWAPAAKEVINATQWPGCSNSLSKMFSRRLRALIGFHV